ncbi:MAG: glycosyltransferase family 4 protein [Natronosporangium sp.]
MRRPRPRVVLAALATMLMATLVATAVTQSWWALQAALLLLAAAVAFLALEGRQVRTAIRAVRHSLGGADPGAGLPDPGAPRVVRLENRVAELADELRRTRMALAISWYDQAKATGVAPARLVPADLRSEAVVALVARGDLLDAHVLAGQTGILAQLPVGLLRRLRRGLHTRGYLTKAANVAEVAVAASGHSLDVDANRWIQGEITVLSGRVLPGSDRTPRPVEGIAGRVLHLVGRSLPGDEVGYTLRTHYTAVAQARAGLDPHVATQMGYPQALAEPVTEVLDGVPYHRVPGAARSDEPFDVWLVRHMEQTAKLVRQLRPAVLHAASDFVNAHTAIAVGRASGVPVVYDSRGFWEETWLSQKVRECDWDIDRIRASYGLPEAYGWRRALEEAAFRDVDHVVTLGPGMADRVAAVGVPADRITVVPNAVDPEGFRAPPGNPTLAGDLGLPVEATIIGYVSSLVEYEGIDTLISAYATARDLVDTPVALLIVGDGPAREQLAQQAEALGLADVVFTGPISHDAVRDYYRVIDIFVVPRRPVEVCHLVPPLKPFEAFAAGCTVVVSDVRALRAIAEESGAAETFRAGDAASLADTLLALLKEPERRRELAATGTAWVCSHRTWAANAQAYVRLYAALSGEPASTG